MVFHNVFQLKNQVESSKTPPRALSITQISKMITPISIVPQCVSYLCNPSLIGGIRDFGTFPEISRRYLDPFESALTRSFGKRAKAPLRVNPEQTKAVRLGSRGVDNSGFDDY
jgi:hypothetical protein